MKNKEADDSDDEKEESELQQLEQLLRQHDTQFTTYVLFFIVCIGFRESGSTCWLELSQS